MTEKVNPPGQATTKKRCTTIANIDLTRETLGELQGLEAKVHEILGRKGRVSHDTMIRLMMAFFSVDEQLSKLMLGEF